MLNKFLINKKDKFIIFRFDMPNILKLFIIFIFIIISKYKSSIKYIELDNQIFDYENDTDFTSYKTDIKAIAFYSPINNDWQNIINKKPLYKGNHQPRIPGDILNYLGYYKIDNENIFKKQVELAKRHGIYGFAIYIFWFSGQLLFKNFLKTLINNDFNFLFVWKNENLMIKLNNYKEEEEIKIIKQEYTDSDPELFIKDIKGYLILPLYIKINGKPILGIFNPNEIPKINETIKIWREKSLEFGIGKIYVIINLNNDYILNMKNLNIFDSFYDFGTLKESDKEFKVNNQNYYLYSYLIYKKWIYKKIKHPIYKCSILEFDKSYNKKKSLSFYNYSPEQFYILNKKIINWTKKNYKKKNRIFFINSWNNWNEGCYLEPDIRFGYASINSLSKAIFNLPYKNQYKLDDLNITNKISIQVHVYYEDLINDILTKINKIPVKFSLFISTDSNKKKDIIEKYIKKNFSKSINYEILVLKNKGRDVLPFIIQLKNLFKKFKYICHIHTKKSLHSNMGNEWRNYLIFNLLGNKDIISDILTDFETNNKLGLIFPQIFYKILLFFNMKIVKSNLNKMNYLIKQIDPKIKIKDKISEFPAGNMFWARTSAIYQIFKINIQKNFPNELGQLDFTIMHAIERIWTYLTKLNGYYYKIIFKHF